jgi:transposase
MLQLSYNSRYWLYRQCTDIRKSFDGLCGIIRNELKQNPLSGDVFIFINRRRTHIKLLTWEQDGFALYYKRLEKGTYELPAQNKDGSINVSPQQLILMLQGISLKQVKYRLRYPHFEQKCG